MAPPRRTPLRHDSPIDRPSTRQSPSDSARITTFGIRGQSLSPISPRTSTAPLASTPNNNTTTSTQDVFNTNASNFFLASPESRPTQQQQQTSFIRPTPRSGFLDQFGSPFHDNSSLFGSPRNDDLLQARNYARRNLFHDPSSIINHSLPHVNSRKYRLRVLRNEAAQHHLNETAIFFAEKVVAITSDSNDVYFLANAYYQSQNYEQALDIINNKQALNKNIHCRYLAGLCAMALEKWQDALDYLGHDNPFLEKDFVHNANQDGGIKLESVMCYTRGNAYLQMKETNKAKKCFMEALTVDVKCYDALEALVQHNMLDEKEEWEFIMTLPYDAHCEDDADFIRDLYMLRLKRYSHSNDISEAQRRTEQDYRLTNSLDVMQSAAETFLSERKYEDCLKICEKIRKVDVLYRRCIPTYLSCLYELKRKTELYELAQDLVDRMNADAVTWYAVGTYYMCIQQYNEAKQYFNQSTKLDSHFEAAWLGLGHAFAAERDYEDAISAYQACSNLVPGSHLPYMYIGIQCMEQDNMVDSFKYLTKSMERCDNDPVLYIEFGVYHYHVEEYQQSLASLEKALTLSKENKQTPSSPIWEKIWANMGHAHRRLQEYDDSLRCYKLALSMNPQNSNVHAGLGLIYHYYGDHSKAIYQYNLVNSFQI
ncbi:hypothetical protein BC941DRAFT_348821 [Chlamydoabsidia padenii]|nr:hypothetical protein BC941DRAFT_348821 [Chlamydoabsidia padenii]